MLFVSLRFLRAHDAGDTAGSGVLVQNALAGSLVDRGNGGDNSLVSVGGTGRNGGLCLLDNRLQVGLDGLVVRGLLGSLTNAVFLGFNVGHNTTSFMNHNVLFILPYF